MVPEAVTSETQTTGRGHIDHLLGLVESSIESRREIVEEIGEWDHASLNSYLAELPLENDDLSRLKESRTEMTKSESDRYEKILSSMKEHEANLDAIFSHIGKLKQSAS